MAGQARLRCWRRQHGGSAKQADLAQDALQRPVILPRLRAEGCEAAIRQGVIRILRDGRGERRRMMGKTERQEDGGA